MPRPSVDPARLEGDALNRWFRRTPDEIEAERRAAEDARHTAFFGGLRPAAVRQEVERPIVGATPSDPEVLWVATGSGYRAVRRGQSDFLATLEPERSGAYSDLLPGNAAALEEGEFANIGSRENKLLKQFYVEKYGFWPKTADGRDYEVSHKKPIADGGKNTLSNIEPIHPDDHRPMHVREGDSSRWGKRGSIAAVFGGKVEPWHGGPATRAFGLGGTLLNLPSLLMHPPRTDSLENFATDILGLPSMDEYRKAWTRPKVGYSDCPPGQMCA